MPEDIKNFHKAYMHLNYDQFLEVLDGRDDSYWTEKWDEFHKAAKALGKLGSFIPKLIEAGSQFSD